MPQLLRQFETLDEPVTSPSGAWALRYDADGSAAIRHHNGTTTWTAGVAGALRLELEGVFAVYEGDQVVWRGDLPKLRYSSLRITDDGDGIIYDGGLPVFSLLGGPIEPVSLGNKAPAAEIHGNRFLESENGKRTVNRTADGDALVCKTKLGLGAASVNVVQPAEARTLDQPDTWLTWRFLDADGDGHWALVLVGPDDELIWVHRKGNVTESGSEPVTAPAAAAEDNGEVEEGDWPQPWMDTGLLGMDGGYCITVIHDVSPDEALRRFGAEDDQVSTSTWAELLRRASYEEAYDHQVVAAFSLGSHTLLVENNGAEGTHRPDLSHGTFAVSSSCSINADQTFLVSRDGEILARFDEGCPSDAEGADPDVLTEPLSEMGIDDPEAFDKDDDNFLEDLELLCRVANVRPTVADVTGPAHVAILPMQFPPVSHR
jgi:hypothetical protein